MSPFIWEWSICPWSIGFVLSPAGGPGSWASRDSPSKKANVKAALVRARVEAREQYEVFISTLSVFDQQSMHTANCTAVYPVETNRKSQIRRGDVAGADESGRGAESQSPAASLL